MLVESNMSEVETVAFVLYLFENLIAACSEKERQISNNTRLMAGLDFTFIGIYV